MEPVGLLVVGGALVLVASSRLSRKSLENARRRTPPSLPVELDAPSGQNEAAEVVLAIHIREATLTSQLANKQIKVRVKHGEPAASVFCDTDAVDVPLVRPVADSFVAHVQEPHPNSEAHVDFATTCLFKAVRSKEAVIRIRLMSCGIFDRTLSKYDFRLPPPFQFGRFAVQSMATSVHLKGRRDEELGRLSIAVEMHCVTRAELRDELELLGAQRRNDAFIVTGARITQGKVAHDDIRQVGARILRGLPLEATVDSDDTHD